MKIVALVLAVGAAVAFTIVRMRREPPPEVDTKRGGKVEGVFSGAVTKTTVVTKPFEAIGKFAADEVLGVIGSSGTIALVREVPDPKSPTTGDASAGWRVGAAQIDAFKEALKRKGKFTFLPETKLVRLENSTTTAWTEGQFGKLLQGVPANTTIIVYCVLPEKLSESEKTMLRNRSGKLIVIGSMEPLMKPLVQDRLVHLAVTMRMPPAPPTGEETPAQMASRVYAVLKPGEGNQPK